MEDKSSDNNQRQAQMVAQSLGRMHDKLEKLRQKNKRLTEKLKEFLGDDRNDSVFDESNEIDSPAEDIDELLRKLMKGGPKSSWSHQSKFGSQTDLQRPLDNNAHDTRSKV